PIARIHPIHAVSLAWFCMRILTRMAHRRAGRNCTAAHQAIRAGAAPPTLSRPTSVWALSFWVTTSMLSRQAHTALRPGTTHATLRTALPSMRGGCHCAGVLLRRVPRSSKIAHLLSATSTSLAGRLHLERHRWLVGL